MKFTITSSLVLLAVSAIPMLVFAQTSTVTDIPSLFTFVLNFINSIVVPLVFAVAFVAFIVGIYIYFIQNGGNTEKRQEGTRFLMWSLIGFFIMFSVWGLINLFLGTLGFNNSSQPTIPTFNATGSGTLGNGLFGNTGGGLFGNTGSTLTGSSIPVGSTVAPISGTCPSGSSPSVVNAGVVVGCQVTNSSLLPSNATQTSNGISGGAGQGEGSVSTGGACDSSADCTGNNECNTNTHTCQAGVDGVGEQGDQCTQNDECDGGLVCDENSMTCQDDNAAGVSAVGEGQGNVAAGGSCNSSADCQGSLECSAVTQKCQAPTDLGEQGDECSSDNECDGNLVCDTNSETCQPNDNAGVQETGDGSANTGSSSVTCPDGTTADNFNDCDDPQDF